MTCLTQAEVYETDQNAEDLYVGGLSTSVHPDEVGSDARLSVSCSYRVCIYPYSLQFRVRVFFAGRLFQPSLQHTTLYEPTLSPTLTFHVTHINITSPHRGVHVLRSNQIKTTF